MKDLRENVLKLSKEEVLAKLEEVKSKSSNNPILMRMIESAEKHIKSAMLKESEIPTESEIINDTNNVNHEV